MARKIGEPVLDPTDEAIIRLLEEDGRLAHREIAARVGLSRSATAGRVQRLLGEGLVDVRGAAHPAVLGHDALAHVAVAVRGPAARVADAIAARPDTTFVSLVSGPHAVVAELRAATVAEIDAAVADVRSTPGVGSVETLVYTEVLRDVAGPVGQVDPATADLDATDYALLRALQEDGRASYVDLAGRVGLSPAGARRRVVRLLEGNVVRVGAVVRHSGRERRTATGVGLRLEGAGREVGEALAGHPSVVFVARTLGRYDLLLTVNTATAGDLVDTLDHLRALPGVRQAETWSHLRFVKETYASLRLGEGITRRTW
ncbi:Lrp/AsnC family transcriptional regulator [Nocardioides sp. GCM10027113]|uniref:Lrp/AsnC family transcriptional regulator n=1 Tax=unclassified Nocardioides TaxID=2615069 RepID=UPI00360F16C5